MPNSEQQPRRVVMATAGHVDHGKTALIRALTGTDTDRLPDEKRRGISIELGFAELEHAGISFIDVPGHRKLVHAMIAGVGGVDAVLLVVAADDGVMPQTREHLHICKLLGIRRAVVALTKVDLVDEEMLELARADVTATLEAHGIAASTIVPTSVVSGQGIPELEAALVDLAKTVPARSASERVWLPVDRVFSIKGSGTVVTGTLTRGRLRVGETVLVAGPRGRRESVCRSLEVHGRSVDCAGAPTRIAVNLGRLDLADVARGDVVTRDPLLPITRRIDTVLGVLPASERALDEGKPVMIYAGTARRTARVTLLGEGFYHLVLDEPFPCQGGVGIVLRGFRATREHGAVLAGGHVLDAEAPPPPRRREVAARELRVRMLAAVSKDDWAQAIGLLMQIAAPRAIGGSDIERRFGLEPGSVSQSLAGKTRKGPADALSLPSGDSWTTSSIVQNVSQELEAHLASFHRDQPHEIGLSLETLRASLGARAGRDVTDLALEHSASQGRIRVEAGVACLSAFAETSGPRAEQAASRVLETLDGVGLEGASEASLSARLPEEREQVVRAALSRLAAGARARRLSGLWFSERCLDALRDKVVAHLRDHASMSVSEFKELAGVSRKQAIPLLEQLDREGTTRRQGDDRVLGAAAQRR